MNTKIASIAFSLLLTAGAAFAAASDPAEFVMQYYKAKEAAKTPLDTRPFLSADVRAKQDKFAKEMGANGPPPEMMQALGGMINESEPKKIRIVSKQIEANMATFNLEATEVPQCYKDMSKGATSSSLKGKVVLVKEGNDWKVNRDFWHFEAVSKDGSQKQTVGINPESSADEGMKPVDNDQTDKK